MKIEDSRYLENLVRECDEIVEEFYSKENLLERRVYLRDETETRVSNAIMVALGDTPLPVCEVDWMKYPFLNNLLIEIYETEGTPTNTRYMINFQKYFPGSKPVPEHYDGEFFEWEHEGDYNFKIEEALIPRQVTVVNLANEGTKGVYLRSTYSDEIKFPDCSPGEVITFDNLEYRHAVPSLDYYRYIVGFRNFDHKPYHFLNEQRYNDIPLLSGYVRLEDEKNGGYIKEISDEEAARRMSDFNTKIWPTKFSTMMNEGTGGVF